MQKRTLKKLLCLIVCMWGNFFYAQTVKGKVTSGGANLPGVSVIVQGTKNGTVTDFDGSFVLNNVEPKALLLFSYVGYKNLSIPADTKAIMQITMVNDLEKLNEVVVIGYGTSKRKDINGAVSSIKASEIQDKPFVSIDQALVGKAAGVNVTQNSGTPGGGISVQIRGITSINGNEPLYVIDGTPVFADKNNETFSFSALGGGNGQTKNSALSGLNISDIETIDILKDASATAIYGANGANGVVLITTKKGKKGKSKFAYETYLGTQEITNTVDVLNLPQYAKYQAKIYKLNGEPVPFQYQKPDLLGNGTNWQDELFRTATMYNHQLSFSGEKEGTRFYTSLNYFDQEGIVLNSDFNRLSMRLNVDSNVKSWLKIGNSLSVSKSSQQVVRNDDRGGLVMNALRQSPELPVRTPDGSYAGPTTGLGSSANEATNPIALSEYNNSTTERFKINGNLFADFTLIKGLVFRTELGYDLNFSKSATFAPKYTLGNVSELLNKSFKQQDQSYYWNIKNYLTYNKTINDKHNFTFLLGQEAQESRYEYISGYRTGEFLNKDFTNLNIGDIDTALNGNGSGRWSMSSYISRLNYSFSDRYSFSASLRADASSNFGPNNKWGYFPSFSGGWTVSNEEFFQPLSNSINYLKFRAGYGLVGNQNIPANRYQTILSLLSSPFGGVSPTIDNLGNPDIKWESLKSFNAGFELAMLNNRVKLDFDYYIKNSSDFLTKQINDESNQSALNYYLNTGEIVTKGIELTLNTRNISTENFSWDSTIIFSKYNNELTSFQGEGKSLLGKVQFDLYTVTRTTEGEPVGQFYGYVTDGLFKNAAELAAGPTQETGTGIGDIRFKDLNGDGKIDSKDQTAIGSAIPDFTYAFTNNFKYKNLSLSVVLTGSQGNQIYNFTRHYTDGIYPGFGDRFGNVSTQAMHAFEPGVNENTDVPRITLNDPNGNGRISNRFVEDGSYLRIQNVSLSYDLPNKIFDNSFISKVRLYVNVQNLYTFTKYTGFDPALGNLDQNITLSGIDLGRYPVPRTTSVGVNLEF
ncbi:TonB-linked outer membrane protein, SusC/RagA family [Flavobacterium sp. CF108]|uniref:SusC/RagA family TonB-linked outer membrane protein n=1 Tax=unclassified Flavobacterium TaxID=196869 RepID=UPI0008CADFF8|nr:MULTISPECIES: TonB-dependent receptor [unclassified Flavobacterium]SEP03384.1 TonB-linked outer membrane protein, SusC/RagA family [Flavobacterium sp. fv08]SHH97997.1 TonB-linked outer membrane protein, SusC/RagA family [Flavobacterium sp. CF108]